VVTGGGLERKRKFAFRLWAGIWGAVGFKNSATNEIGDTRHNVTPEFLTFHIAFEKYVQT
jgi:hypothetical protein